MKKDEVENMLGSLDIPEPENVLKQGEFKIPLLSFKKSSKVGLWLLIVPMTFAVTVFLKMELGLNPTYLSFIHNFFASINNNKVLTYLIPVIFIGFPLLAMILNFLAICHFQRNKKMKELIVTIKYRLLNIVIFLLSFATLIFFLLPDKLAF